jgi:aminopeptidase N
MKIIQAILLLLAVPVFAQQHQCAVGKQHSIQTTFNKAATLPQQYLMEKYDVVFHHLDLNIEKDTTYISGNVRTVARVIASQLDTFGFELHSAFTIDSVVMVNTRLTVIRNGHFAYALLPVPVLSGALADVKIYYHGTAPAAASAAIGAGFSSLASGRWGNRATWSLSQPYSAYEWWPCKQSLQDKIDSVQVFITTNSENKAGSQGLLQQVVSLPNQKVRYEWKSTYPIDYYLVSVSVAKYVEYNTYAVVGGNIILIQDYIYDNPQTFTTFKPVLDQTASMIELFSDKFGMYPFANEKYGHAMAPFSGGMEHQTMTTLGIIDFGIVAHELGHQWFGDHVTCKTWSDIWLNEGFASYCEYLALEFLNPGDEAAAMQKVHNFVMQSPGGSIWFEDTTDVSRIFDSRLTYNKGSAFIHTLRYEINNDTLFFDFLREYQSTFGFATANTLEFKALLEQKTGRSFTQVFDQWFYGEGYPTYAVRWNQLNDTVYIASNQLTSTTVTPLFTTPLDILVKRTEGDTLIRVTMDQINMAMQFAVTGHITSLKIDPDNWILNDATVVKDATINGLNDIGASQQVVYYYPNPVKTNLTVQSQTAPIVSMNVYDATGKQLFTTYTTTIEVGHLARGLYFFVAKTADGHTQPAQRFIKE